jgi:hypothetical protein
MSDMLCTENEGRSAQNNRGHAASMDADGRLKQEVISCQQNFDPRIELDRIQILKSIS